MEQDNDTNCNAGVQHYTQAESDEDSDFCVHVPEACVGTDEHDVLTMLERDIRARGAGRTRDD